MTRRNNIEKIALDLIMSYASPIMVEIGPRGDMSGILPDENIVKKDKIIREEYERIRKEDIKSLKYRP